MNKFITTIKAFSIIGLFVAAYFIAVSPKVTVEAVEGVLAKASIDLPQLPSFEEETEEDEANEAVVENVATNKGWRAIDPNYTATPKSHDAETSAANANAFALVAKNNAEAEAAQVAKQTIASQNVNNFAEKSEDLKAKEIIVNEEVVVVVEGDGSSEVVSSTEGGDTTSSDEQLGDGEAADNRELIELGEIPFGDESAGQIVVASIEPVEPVVVTTPVTVNPEPEPTPATEFIETEPEPAPTDEVVELVEAA